MSRYFSKMKMVEADSGGLRLVPVWVVVRRSTGGVEREVGPECRNQMEANNWALALDEAYGQGRSDGSEEASERAGVTGGGWE